MSDTVVLFENVHPLADRAFEAAGLPIERHAAALAVSDLHDRLSGALLAGIRSRTRMDKAAFDATAPRRIILIVFIMPPSINP